MGSGVPRMLNIGTVRTYALALFFAIGAAAGLMVYYAFLAQTTKVQSQNLDESLGLIKTNLKSFDIMALENISQVLFGADYITGLKITTGNGFVVFNGSKRQRGVAQTYEFSEPRENGEIRRIGTVVVEINRDPNAIRNIAISGLTGGLLSFLLVRLILSARRLRRELVVRESSENALREQEGNLRILLNSLTEAVIATDSSGRISQMNPVAERLTGWSFLAAAGQPIDSVFQAVDGKTRERLGSQFGTVVTPRRDRGHNPNVILLGRDGVEYPISYSVAPMMAGENRVSGVVIVFRDITAELQAQQRIREMEKMQAVGVLAGGIAHDFNNLLGIISASAEIISLKRRGELTASSAKLLDTIIRTTRRGADLTSKLLAVGGRTSTDQTLLSLHTSIENVVTVLKRTIDKRFDVEVRLQAEDHKILGNTTLIENALLNIGLNASQAMKDDRGAFTILTENVTLQADDEAVRMHHAPVGPCVKIILRDNGVGVPPENLNRIFEPFFTNRRGGGGFGLGLWAVYNTIHDHGGAIYAESQLGVETTFHIYLPLSFELIAPTQNEHSVASMGHKQILIVDDEEDIRVTLSAMLSALGCGSRIACGGREAIDIFRNEGRLIDAVMMDLNMPEMSGEDTIAAIRTIDPTIPVVISSGYPIPSQFPDLKETGPVLFLKKPYLLVELAATLSEVFGENTRLEA